jgi:BirA family transcriptional regulator, biotin operon repressor / biotin---[acetyl-CoA-carboxylase] ligase
LSNDSLEIETMAEPASQILRLDSLPSTNLEAAKRAIEGAPEGLCVVANEQTAGRGRFQRQWISPKGTGLYLSIILRPQIDHGAWSLITLAAALAVHDALLEACSLETDIKWPNDVLADERKLCGILAETVETKLGGAVVLGIGINLTSDSLPPELKEIATSVESATGKRPDREVVLQALLGKLRNRYAKLQQQAGAEETIREWCKHSSYAQGKRIRVANANETLEGTTRGVESDGALRLETDAGEITVVRAGDVTVVRSSVDRNS